MLVRKALKAISVAGNLTPDDIDLLVALAERVEERDAGSTLVSMKQASSRCHLIVEGVASRFIGSEQNRRITNFLVPGDFIDIHQLFYGETPFWLLASTRCRVVAFDTSRLSTLIIKHRNIAEAFWRTTLRDAAIEREWLMNIARRDIAEKVAHLLFELVTRLQIVEPQTAIVPLATDQLAEAAHCDPSNVASVLASLQHDSLITAGSEGITIVDAAALRRRAGFDPAYLALNFTAK